MKKLLILLTAACLFASPAFARYQRGYYKPSTGKYVQSHYKTNSDSTRWNNYSTKGNFNPYTGQKGYRSPYKTPSYGTRKYRY